MVLIYLYELPRAGSHMRENVHFRLKIHSVVLYSRKV